MKTSRYLFWFIIAMAVAFSPLAQAKPKIVILRCHINDSSVWKNEFIFDDVVNRKAILT